MSIRSPRCRRNRRLRHRPPRTGPCRRSGRWRPWWRSPRPGCRTSSRSLPRECCPEEAPRSQDCTHPLSRDPPLRPAAVQADRPYPEGQAGQAGPAGLEAAGQPGRPPSCSRTPRSRRGWTSTPRPSGRRSSIRPRCRRAVRCRRPRERPSTCRIQPQPAPGTRERPAPPNPPNRSA